MRQRLVMGNWKLNGTKETVVSLIKTFAAEANKYPKVEAAICAPSIFIGLVEENAKGSRLAWGSEDVDVNNQGAFTGENSPVQIKEFGCKYAIVGHSERRGYHNESSEYVAKKFKAAQAAGLKPVLCIGESLEEFEAGKTNEVVDAEIKAVIDENGIDSFKSAVIAYEPIWAIGTGKTATAEQAEEVCCEIRAVIRRLYGARSARAVSILYGGSMNAKNAAELLAQPDIDGGLIGGASLKPVDFATIVAATAQE